MTPFKMRRLLANRNFIFMYEPTPLHHERALRMATALSEIPPQVRFDRGCLIKTLSNTLAAFGATNVLTQLGNSLNLATAL